MAAAFLIVTPWAPDVYPWLIIFRIGLAISSVAALCHPLITDYIKKTSRGKATAFQSLGFVVGDLFTFVVLF
jgi:MFS family permease